MAFSSRVSVRQPAPRRGVWLCASALLPLLNVAAMAAPLQVGDPAPPLKPGRWLQGEPVTAYSRDNVYIVEFWATWCGPCVASIPHLNELATKYGERGLVVIGQNVYEKDESKLEPFLEEMGEQMTFRVACDDKRENEHGVMLATWLDAAGWRGIPCAFVIGKDGKIVFVGNPMDLTESMIEEVLTEKSDLSEPFATAAEALSEQQVLNDLWARYSRFRDAMIWEEAEATLENIAEVSPEAAISEVPQMRVSLLFDKKDLDAAANVAWDYCATTVDTEEADRFAYVIAVHLLAEKNLSPQALAIASDLATRAHMATGGNDVWVLYTLARAKFREGDATKAIELQTQALELAEKKGVESELRKRIQTGLDDYSEGRLPPQ